MDAHQRQQFDVLLASATDRCAERLEQRHEGAEPALARLAAGEVEAELRQFVEACFRDALLDSADGAAWVLAALARRPAPALDAGALGSARSVGDVAGAVARAAFASLLRQMVEEELTRRAAFGAHLLSRHA